VGLAFLRSQARAASPLVQLSVLRDGEMGASLVTSVVISTVVMATLVVGPFYLSRGLGLAPAVVGAALSVGPLTTAAAAVPAGRVTDRFGAYRATLAGLALMTAGLLLLVVLPSPLGAAAYVVSIAVVTLAYAFVQTANNAGMMADVRPDQRGLAAALLGLSRNVGLITGASAMGAVFSLGAGGNDVATTAPTAVAVGMRVTYAVAAVLVLMAVYATLRGRYRRASGRRVMSPNALTRDRPRSHGLLHRVRPRRLGQGQQCHERGVRQAVPIRGIGANAPPSMVVLEDQRPARAPVERVGHLVDPPTHAFGDDGTRGRKALPRRGGRTAALVGRHGMLSSA
jgi:MFS family permease